MKKVFFGLLALAIYLSNGEVFAQQDAQFSQYMFNTLYYNPAYAGVDGTTQIMAMHRSQWAGYSPSGAPTTQFLSLNAPILRLRSGIGFNVVNDRLGPLNNLEAQVTYAYHLGIKNSKLSFGIKAGIFAQIEDFDKLNPIDKDDELIQLTGKETQVRPDLGVGLFYRTEKYYAGISFNHLLESEFDFGVDKLKNPLEPHMTFTAGYDYEMSFDLILTPSVIIKSDLNTYSFDLSVIGTYKEKMWGGLSFRQQEAAIVMLGYSLTKTNALKVGYAFDYIISGQDAKEPTSHELMLSYTLPVSGQAGKKFIRTPRFRH